MTIWRFRRRLGATLASAAVLGLLVTGTSLAGASELRIVSPRPGSVLGKKGLAAARSARVRATVRVGQRLRRISTGAFQYLPQWLRNTYQPPGRITCGGSTEKYYSPPTIPSADTAHGS